MRLGPAVLAALLVAPGCSIFEPRSPEPEPAPPPSAQSTSTQSPSRPPAAGGAEVQYAVRFRDGGTADATVSYLLPGGTRREENVRIPWESPALTFGSGATLSIHATAPGAEARATLLCVLKAVPPTAGAWVGGGVESPIYSPPPGATYGACATEYRLGAWPPPEDDPEHGNLLIRVG
jgi:hypothetical protein